LKAHLLLVLATTVMLWSPEKAHASPDDTYASAVAKMKSGDFAGALELAAQGYNARPEQRFLFVKARANDKLGKHEAAWAVMQLIQPGNLPEDQQEFFVSEYERMDKANKARAEQARKAAEDQRIEAEVQRRMAQTHLKKTPPPIWRWVASAGCAGTGIALTLLGRVQAYQANDDLGSFGTYGAYESDYAQSETLYAVGLSLGAVGVASLIWTLIDHMSASKSEETDTSFSVTPFGSARGRQVGLQLRF